MHCRVAKAWRARARRIACCLRRSAAALAEAQKADKPVALLFRADGCPTFRAQDKQLEATKAEPGLDLTVLAWLPDAWVNLTIGI